MGTIREINTLNDKLAGTVAYRGGNLVFIITEIDNFRILYRLIE
ncbi:hypothetical protein SDC9_138295 [bioreactor metagenome]|uniref:Uncharacterized protein n=1 Tax=bioreactor metagenome TaxID=1076179 RepID=A0A645DPW9_9ZZZZ